MKASVDRVLVELKEHSEEENQWSIENGDKLLQEAKVVSMGVDSDGHLNSIIKDGDTILVEPNPQGYSIDYNGKKLVLLRKSQIGIIK